MWGAARGVALPEGILTILTMVMRFSAETPLPKIQSPQRSDLRDGWRVSSDRRGRGAHGSCAAPRAAGEIFFSSHHVRILLPIYCSSTAHLLTIYYTRFSATTLAAYYLLLSTDFLPTAWDWRRTQRA
mgnify:CR=1 FL=1